MNTRKILDFLHQIEQAKSTLRHNWTTTGRQEDIAAHMWRVAVLCMLMNELKEHSLDSYKTLCMLLVHDIPEIVHGDIPGFRKGKKDRVTEEEAAKQVFSTLPSPIGDEWFGLYVEFEKDETPEAHLANALDKIETMLQHAESGPRYWVDEERGDHMLHYPDKAVEKLHDPDIEAIWKNILNDLERMNYSNT